MAEGSQQMAYDVLDPLIVSEHSECFRWTDEPANTGYGRLRTLERQQVHRFVYELCVSQIPVGFHVHHRCGNKLCANPLHLEALSPRDHFAAHKPEACKRCGRVEWSYRSDGKRDCVPCRREYDQRRRAGRGAR